MSSYRFVRFSTLALTLCAAFFIWAATASSAAISTFDTDAENWSVVSFTNPNAGDFSVVSTTAPTYNATGGNPGRLYLDPRSRQRRFHVQRPEQVPRQPVRRRTALLRLELSGRQPRLQASRHHAHRRRDAAPLDQQPNSRSAPASPTSRSASRPPPIGTSAPTAARLPRPAISKRSSPISPASSSAANTQPASSKRPG